MIHGDVSAHAGSIPWGELQAWLEALGRRRARGRWGLDEGVGADAAQEALLGLLVALRGGASIVSLRAWLRHALECRLTDAVRRLAVRRPPVHCGGRVGRRRSPRDPQPGPDQALVLADLWNNAPALFARLPAPHRQIAERKHLHAWPNAEIAAWLARWLGVSPEGARHRMRVTNAMLRALGDGLDLRARWPRAYKLSDSLPPPPTRAT